MALAHLDPFNPSNNSFGLREKVFNFGTVIARLPEPGPAKVSAAAAAAAAAAPSPAKGGGKEGGKGGGTKGAAKARGDAGAGAGGSNGNGAAAAELASAGGGTAGAPVGGSSSAAAMAAVDDFVAVKANLKFTNPIKVPCTVNFTIKPRGGATPNQRFPMEVHPASIVIPPNESRWVWGAAKFGLAAAQMGRCSACSASA